jgi:uncharacterized protein
MSEAEDMPSKPKSKKGFASLSVEQRREISKKGGIAAHAAGTAHEFSREEAVRAGRLGGRATHSKKRTDVVEE